jgi:hypothetical protein
LGGEEFRQELLEQVPLAWIAERLNMGTRGHLAWLLQQWGKSRRAAPANQNLLRI